jgi:hypothetical protein
VETKTSDKPVPQEIAALLSGERVILRETKRAVTPYGGAAVFISFLRKIDLAGHPRAAYADHEPALAGAAERVSPSPDACKAFRRMATNPSIFDKIVQLESSVTI